MLAEWETSTWMGTLISWLQLQGEIRGVPLGALAACISDAQEDFLKAQVLATAVVQKECSSSAGIYRFLETKNLNAFLIWVERNPARKEADRCVELSHALACLRSQNGKEPNP